MKLSDKYEINTQLWNIKLRHCKIGKVKWKSQTIHLGWFSAFPSGRPAKVGRDIGEILGDQRIGVGARSFPGGTGG